MKIKIAGLFMAFLCLAMVTGSAFAAPVVKPNIVTKTIDVRTNPSTGYSWNAEYDHSKVELIKNYYTQDHNTNSNEFCMISIQPDPALRCSRHRNICI